MVCVAGVGWGSLQHEEVRQRVAAPGSVNPLHPRSRFVRTVVSGNGEFQEESKQSWWRQWKAGELLDQKAWKGVTGVDTWKERVLGDEGVGSCTSGRGVQALWLECVMPATAHGLNSLYLAGKTLLRGRVSGNWGRWNLAGGSVSVAVGWGRDA